MRSLLVTLHRWLGLFIAVFLFIAGLTGALIAWDHELDSWLNPAFYHTQTHGDMQSPLVLANRIEAANPGMQISYLPLGLEPGEVLSARVETIDGSDPQFNEVFVDPYSGQLIASRLWGEFSLNCENLIPFLYKLHYSMHLPNIGSLEFGLFFMGIIGIVWAIDCFVALWISFPNLQSWRKSFTFRWKQGGHKLIFDLHRSGGVWIWGLLLMMAVTSISMNLNYQVMRPVVAQFSKLSPSVLDMRSQHLGETGLKRVSREQIVQEAKAEAERRGWQSPAGGIYFSGLLGLYGVGFFEPGMGHGDGGLGNPWLYFDAFDGKLVGENIPGAGSTGDIFLQAQFPLHSGRILGIAGRVMVTALGSLIAVLSLTGIIIWAKKRVSRNRIFKLAFV